MAWKPIDTAPKDGTAALVWGDPYSHDWAIFIAKAIGQGLWQTYDGCDLEPTHWHPLPAPPASVDERPQGQDAGDRE